MLGVLGVLALVQLITGFDAWQFNGPLDVVALGMTVFLAMLIVGERAGHLSVFC